jgi:hypothetical protein
MPRFSPRRATGSQSASVLGGGGVSRGTVGALAASSWLAARGTAATGLVRWHAEIAMGITDDPVPVEFDENLATRFHVAIYSEEWGVFLCHGGRWSWIRVTDLAFVHTRDDFGLISRVPPLDQLGTLLRRIERDHSLSFRRDRAVIHTNLVNAEPAIRAWLLAL